MAARLALFRAEGRAEAVDFAKGEDIGLVVELAGLGQVGRLAVEIDLEERCSALGGVGREDWRIDVEEAVVVEPVADGTNDGGAHAQYGPLAAGANPEVAVFDEKLDAMLFGLDRVVVGELDQFEAGRVEFIAAGDAGARARRL